MAYSTQSDLYTFIEQAELEQLCTLKSMVAGEGDEAAPGAAEVASVVAGAIAQADATIDGLLLNRYPGLRSMSPVPVFVKMASAILAVHALYLRRRSVDDDWAKKYENTMATLKLIADGSAELVDGAGTGPVAETTAIVWSDCSVMEDDDLTENDQRRYTPSKQAKLFGV